MDSSPSIALIQTPCYELQDDRLEPHLGLLYLATLLRSAGYPAQVVDLSSIAPDRWISTIPPADVYGFSTYTSTYHRTLDLLRVAKTINPSALTVAGGPHATALPEAATGDFDVVVVGEGENALLRLVRMLERGERPPPILREPAVADLDTLPFPDYSLVDIPSYHRVVGSAPSLSILSSRGCPYSCTFCNSIIMGGHKHARFRSAENVAQEIRQLIARYGIRSFRFQDDIFTLNPARLRELMVSLRELDVVFRCFGRVDTCSRAMADLLYQGGCRHIAFGVETGAPELLSRMRKRQSVEDIRRGIASAKAAGLVVRVFLMVGFPGETWATIEQTVDLMLECAPDEFSVYPLIVYPGTPLYHQPEAFGITAINPDFSQYFQVRRGRATGYVFRTADLDEPLIAEMRAYVIDRLEAVATWAGDSKSFK